MNVYDQFIDRKYIFLGAYVRRRRAIEDVSWNKIIIKRIIFINDFNVYSSKWNLIYEKLIKVKVFETLLTKFNLVIINEKGMPTKRLLEKIFIINLVVTSPDIKDIITWYILGKKFLSILDYELIVVNWSDLAEDLAR